MATNKVDYSGETYGYLTAVKYDSPYKWEYICRCGNSVVRNVCGVLKEDNPSCGCNKEQKPRKKVRKDLTGSIFSMLHVLSVDENSRSKKTYYNCMCECGVEKSIRHDALLSGNTKSCGCLAIRQTSERMYIGRDINQVEFNAWTSMKHRCLNKSNKAYKHYGGRGISVCDRWLNSFDNFYEDMGPRPSDNYSIDKIDNDGDYGPNNCRWATKSVQSHNRRPRAGSASKYKGVFKCRKKWFAALTYEGETYRSKVVATEIEAAIDYDNLCRKYIGDLATLNFKEK